MGSGPMSVVDPQLRVRGIAGLRVADASVMPTMVSANPNAACFMIGERCASFIAEEMAALRPVTPDELRSVETLAATTE